VPTEYIHSETKIRVIIYYSAVCCRNGEEGATTISPFEKPAEEAPTQTLIT
jgi:hypothetical protein